MAAAALKERYQKRIKTIHDIMDGKERLEFPGTKNVELSEAMIWRFSGTFNNNLVVFMAVFTESEETALSESSSCHYQMYMQLGAIGPSVRPNALKDLERGMQISYHSTFFVLNSLSYPRVTDFVSFPLAR